MKRKTKLVWALLFMIGFLFFAACAGSGMESQTESIGLETESDTESETELVLEETEAHTHEFLLTNTTQGTCAEQGYHRYECSCGMSYKELIPAAHTYKTVADISGQYTKTVCVMCGAYKIVRNQEYLYNIDFENVASAGEAANQPPNLEFYTIAGNGASLENDGENSWMKIVASNYYVKDTSGCFADDRTVVFSMDIKVEKYARAELFSVIYYYGGSNWDYNRGLIRLEANGTLSFFDNGNGKHTDLVRLSDKGFNNITVVGNLMKNSFDIYLNEQLVREDVSYDGAPKDGVAIYIRYFDREKDFVAYADNLKAYCAETPEFVVPKSGIVFSE